MIFNTCLLTVLHTLAPGPDLPLGVSTVGKTYAEHHAAAQVRNEKPLAPLFLISGP